MRRILLVGVQKEKGKRKKEKGIEIGTQLQENGSVGVSV
jgi:hypothetical protein